MTSRQAGEQAETTLLACYPSSITGGKPKTPQSGHMFHCSLSFTMNICLLLSACEPSSAA